MATEKKTTKKSAKAKQETVASKPSVGPDQYSFALSRDEVLALIQILGSSKDIYAQMVINSLQAGEPEKLQQAYSARAQLSAMLYLKFREVASIGEPTSREIH